MDWDYRDYEEWENNFTLIRPDMVKLLETRPTRQLLSWLRKSQISYGEVEIQGTKFRHAEIKFVLNAREHIPNKQESKLIRQLNAKRKR